MSSFMPSYPLASVAEYTAPYHGAWRLVAGGAGTEMEGALISKQDDDDGYGSGNELRFDEEMDEPSGGNRLSRLLPDLYKRVLEEPVPQRLLDIVEGKKDPDDE